MSDLIAIRDRDAEWRDVADDPLLTPLHLDQHEGATHIERRSCAKAAIVDRRTLLAYIDEERYLAAPAVESLTVAAKNLLTLMDSFSWPTADSAFGPAFAALRAALAETEPKPSDPYGQRQRDAAFLANAVDTETEPKP